MKTTRYILKRIAISIGIIIIMSIIRSFLVINVNALEIENGTKPIIYTPNGKTFTGDINKDELSYNYQLEANNFEIRFLSSQNSTKLFPSLQEDYPYYANDIENKSNFTRNGNNISLGINSHYYINQLTITTGSTNSNYMLKDMKYTILVKMTKTNDLKYYDNNNTSTNIENVDLNYFKLFSYANSSQVDISDKIEVTKFQYIKGLNEKAGGNNPDFSNESFILIEYQTKDSLEENTYSLTNQTISLSINKWANIEGESEYFFKNDKYFIENDTSQEQEIKYNFVFLEGGMVDWCGLGDGKSGGCGRYFGDDMDKVSMEDQKIINQLEDCDPLDIACHVKNGVKMLENIFIRIGNGIKDFFQSIVNLFIPNFDDMRTTMEELKDTLMDKLGFLTESEEYFIVLLEKFQDLEEGNVIIHIPEIKVPNFNYAIINEQDWNFSSPFNDNQTLKAFYDLYKVLISGVFIFLLIEHARYRFGALLNAYDMNENGVIERGGKKK